MTSVIVTTMVAHYVLSGSMGKDLHKWLPNRKKKFPKVINK